MLTSKATQRRRTITERQSVAFCFGRSRKVGKPYAAEGAAEMEKVMDVKNIPIGEIVPYAKNAKKHDKRQIDNVAESIRQYGFVQPVVIDRDGVIVIGHCRVLAAKKLGMEEVPCVCVDDLTPEQVRMLRIVDNKTNESDWDLDLLASELNDLDFGDFDFDFLIDEEMRTESCEAENEEEEIPQSKVGVFSVSAFGMKSECFLELILSEEQAEQIVEFCNKNGGDALLNVLNGVIDDA